jgi:hypothetical protein
MGKRIIEIGNLVLRHPLFHRIRPGIVVALRHLVHPGMHVQPLLVFDTPPLQENSMLRLHG